MIASASSANVIDLPFISSSVNGDSTAAEWKKAHPDKFLWFGEFGTIRHANLIWRENWMRDVIRTTVENDIPFCNWNYLSTPYDCNRFSLVTDDDRRIVSQEMLRLIQGKI